MPGKPDKPSIAIEITATDIEVAYETPGNVYPDLYSLDARTKENTYPYFSSNAGVSPSNPTGTLGESGTWKIPLAGIPSGTVLEVNLRQNKQKGQGSYTGVDVVPTQKVTVP